MEKRKRRGIALYLIVVCCCIIGLLAGISQFRQKGKKSKSEMEQKLEVQKEALEQLKEDEGEYNEKNIILSDTTKAEAKGLAESIGAKVRITKNGKVAVLYLDGDKDIKQVYKNKKYLNYIGKMNPDYYGTLSSTSGIKGRSFTSLADNINLKDTWNQTKGSGTKIAVIDTGIDTDSKYLSSKISEKSFDATTGKVVSDYDISVVEERDQMTSHGTSVASAIAADWDENTGIGGIAPDTELVVINVMSSGEILSSDVIFGISYAIECDVDVINMSFSFEGEKNPFEKYTQLAVDSDIICVAAAGNYSTSTPVWPAADENVIGVGAVNQGEKDESGKMQVSTTIGGSSSEEEQKEFTLSEKSDYGDNVDIVAPDNLKVVNSKGGETILGGTSASSATVAGAVALYLSRNTHEEFSKVKETLYAAGKDMGTPGIDWYYGCGMLDVDALVVEEKGTITYDYLTEELSSEKHIFVRGHILQDVPEPERNYAVFDGWYHDINCTEEWDNLEEVLHEDVTMYAAWANEGDTDAFSYTILEDGTAEIKSYRGKRRYLTIPNRIDGYTVSSIGTRAFVGNSRLRRVELPDTLKTIKEYAFSSCTRLLQIEIPSSVVEIQHHAFSECPRLGAVSIPENGKLTTIGDYAFQECGSLLRMDLPAMLQSVNATAFFKDNSLKKITISEKNTKYDADGEALYQKQDKRTLVCYVPGKSGQYVVDDSTESIGKYAFAYSRLSGVTLPDGLTKLENYSFVSSRIEKITIPEAIEAIPEGCFNECNNLQTVSLGKNLTSIGEYAFTNCQNLEEVQMPKENNIQSIGMNAFYACVKLNNIDFIKSKVSTIDSGAFAACYSVKEVTLPKTLKVLGDRTFVSCYNLETVVFEDGIGLDKLREWTFNGCEALKNIVLPEGLQEIGEDCFLVSGLEFIHIPSTVTNIGYGAFGHCLSMKKIEVDNGSKNYKIIDNVLFKLNDNGEPAILHTYPAGLEGEYKVPDEVTEIAESAFYAANKLTNISFGQNLQKIGRYAFRYISSLTSLEFNANLQEIGEYAFEECGSLTDVKLNENLVTLKTGAFSFCWKLKNINIPDKLQTIEPYCFTYCEDLESIHIAKGVVSIGMRAFSGDTNLTEITFAKDGALSRLNNEAFAYCGITAMTIPSSIQSMGEEVFKNCTKLESVTFEENSKLNAMTAWAFAGADNLKSITFKENAQLTMIQARALERMNSLQTVDISKCTKLTTIDNYAFYGCASMESFAIPANVTEIGRYAFYGCKKFTRLDIPEKMDTIGRYAFAGIPDIKIYFNSAVLPAHLQEYWDYGIRGYYLGTGETHSNADWKYTVLNNGTAVLIEYIGTNTEVNVTTVDGYTVSAVGANVLKEDSTVQSLTLPESVKSICNYAFENTKNLRNISIPASVEMIGTYAFYKSGVEKVNFASDSKLTYIDAYAFSETENLKNINIPEKVTEVRKYAFESSALNEVKFAQNAELNLIGRYAFSNSELQEVQLPDHALKVDYHAFDGITSLNTLKFGTGNTQLYGYAFYNTGLTEVNLPENVEYVGEYCFSFCKELTAINVEEANTQYSSEKGVFFNKKQTKLIQCPAGKSGTYNIPDKTEALGFGAFEGSILSKIGISNSSKLNTIGYKAFYDCEQITSMYIPATLVSVDYYAFAYCKKLSDFTLGEGSVLKGIYEGAFYGCEALQSIEIPDGVVEIGEYAFYGCEALNSVDIKETSNLQGIYAHAFDYTGLTEFTIPDTVNEVGQYAFAHAPLKSISFSKSIVDIGEKVIYKCDAIEKLEIGCLESCDTISYLFGTKNYELAERFIPTTLKNCSMILDNAFRGCVNLVDVEFEATVEYIGAGAFYDCRYLKEISGLENVKKIGEEAFYNCQSITSVGEMTKVESIGKGTFKNCTSLKQAINIQKMYRIPESAFYNCTSLVSIDGIEEVTVFEKYCFENCGLYNVTLVLKEAEDIGDSAFAGTKIKELYFPETDQVKKVVIKYDAFGGCHYMRSVKLSENIKSIGRGAFSSSDFQKIDIPDSVEELGEAAFFGCYKLKEVKIGKGLNKIDKHTFKYCEELRKVEFSGKLECIEDYAFYGCNALRRIILPEGVKSIGEEAFLCIKEIGKEDIPRMGLIWIPNSVKTLKSNAFNNANVFFEKETLPSDTASDWDSENGTVKSFFGCGRLQEYKGLYYFEREEDIIAAYYEGEEEKVSIETVDNKKIAFINDYCFESNSIIKEVDLGDAIESIGERAFLDCKNLESFVLGEKVKTIGKEAFKGSLVKFTKLPSTLQYVGDYALWAVTIENIELSDTLKYLGKGAFQYTTIYNIKLPDNMEELSESLFYGAELKTIELPTGLKKIGKLTFYHSSIKTIGIPENVIEIGDSAFSSCSKLEKVDIKGNNLSKIGAYAFNNCEKLEKLTIPESVTDISPKAFYWSRNLYINFKASKLPETLTGDWNTTIKGYRIGFIKEDYDENSKFSYYLTQKGAEVYKYDGDRTDILIERVGKYPVIKIDESTFEGNEDITSIYIGNTVGEIDNRAFYNCKSLKKAEFALDSPIIKLETAIFRDCSMLKTVVLPPKLQRIEFDAFNNCEELEEIDFPQSLKYVGGEAFYGCPKLVEKEDDLVYIKSILTGTVRSDKREYSIREGTRVIAYDTFCTCKNIEKIEFPKTLKAISASAFRGASIQELDIPENVSDMHFGLYGVKDLKKLRIPYIDGGLESLMSDTTPDSLKEVVVIGDTDKISDRWFAGAEYIENISFEGKANIIGRRAFDYCKNLKTIKWPEGVKRISSQAFQYCSRLEKIEIPDGVVEIEERAFSYCSQLKNIKIPDSVTEIGKWAFSDCSCLKEIELPLNLHHIDKKAFDYSGIHKISLWLKDNEELPIETMQELGKYSREIEIKGNIDNIPPSFFAYCNYVENIILPDTVKTIGEEAFVGCNGLKKLVLPRNVKVIKKRAFAGCSNMKYLSLPEGLEKIEEEAFSGMSELKNISIPSTVTEISDSIFRNSAVENLILKCGEAKITEWTFSEMNGLKVIVTPFIGYSKSNICSLKDMFKSIKCNFLESVILLSSCDIITDNTFKEITGITIYCYADKENISWVQGWNNGNKVCYLDNWNCIEFSVDKASVYSSMQKSGEALKLPPKSLRVKKDDKQHSYTFVGWDVNGDGIADNIFASSLRNFVTANAVYSVVEKDNMSEVTANKLEEQKDGSLNIDATSKQTNIQKAVANISGEKVASIAGKETNIKTDVGTVSFDAAATNIIGQKVKEESLNVSIENVDNSLVTGLSKEDALYNIDMTSGDTDVTFSENSGEETTGYATVTIPYTLEDGEKPIVSYINENGKRTDVESVYNEADKTVSFVTSHFSLYSISKVSAETCTISFDANGGEDVVPITKAKGRRITLPACTREEYILEGWKDTDGTFYTLEDSFKVEKDTTLTAQWKEKINIVTFKDSIQLSEDSSIYNGLPKTPKVSIEGLTEEIDYEVSYIDNLNAGTGKVIITGKGNYTGQAEKTFEITAKDIAGYKEAAELSSESYEYDGNEKKPSVIIDGLVVKEDYELVYKNNVNAGTAEVIVTGQKNYKGSFVRTYSIIPKSITKLEEKIVLSESSYIYDGTEKTPEVSIEGLGKGRDYEVSYADNIDVGTAKVSVTGKGNYAGTAEKEFTIEAAGIEAYEDKVNLSETSYEYDGTEKTPEVTIEGLTEGQDYEVSYEANVNAGTAKVIISGRGNYGGSFEKVFEIMPGSIKKLEEKIVLSENSYIYDGKAKTPKVSIEGLTEGTDYEVGYTDNLNAGTGKVIITGKGNYTGQAEKTFEITAKDIAGYKEAVELSSESYEYDGNEKKPSVIIDGLVVKEDYELIYKNNVNAGTAEVIVTGQKNYKGSFVRTYSITPKSITKLEEKIVLSESSYIYDGTEKTPEVSIEGLSKGRDYEVSYADNIDVGTAKVSVTGKGNYAGTAEKEFTIEAAGIEAYEDKANLSETSYEYDGKEKRPEVRIEGLTEGQDYEVSYEANINAGKAKVIISGKGNYTGNFGKVFEIMPGSIKKLEEKIVLSENSYIYDGKAKTPKVSVEGLTEGTDYEVSYEDNLSVGTAKVILKGKGNYTDTVEKTFTIGHTGIEAYKDKASLSGTSYEYDGTEKRPEVRIEGLAEGQDYEVSYEANINAGKAKVIVSGRGNYGGSFEKTFEIISSSILKVEEKVTLSEESSIYNGLPKTPKVSIGGLTEEIDYEVSYTDNLNAGTGKVIITGKGNYAGTAEKEFTIEAAGIEAYEEKANLSETSYEYDGTEKRPEVTIEGLTEGQDYEVSYEANINAGKAKVIISGKGNYTGSFGKVFEIMPGSIKKLEEKIVLSENSYIYDGKAKIPKVSIEGLTEGTDYEVSYEDNINVGTAKVIFEGKGNYTDTVEKTFTIGHTGIEAYKDKANLSETSYEYDGTEKTPEVRIEGLTEGQDYEVTYEENINAGEAKVIVNGRGNYGGSFVRTFSIVPSSITKLEEKIILSESSYIYDGKAKTPKASIEGLTEGTDYEVSYSDNINVGTAKVILVGKGNYKDTVEKTFTIGHTGIEAYKDKANLSETSYEYDGIEKTPEVVIEGLTEGQDYEVAYEANINAGEAKVIVSGRGNYGGSFEKTYSITPKSVTKLEEKIVLSASSYIYDGKAKTPKVSIEGLTEETDYEVSYEDNINVGTAKVILKGKGNYSDVVEKNFTIGAKGLEAYEKNVKLSQTNYGYDGKAKQPAVYIAGLKANADYTVAYKNNTNIGIATVVIRGKNNYKGMISKRYSITAVLNKTYNISGELYKIVSNASNGSGKVMFTGVTAKKTDKKIKTVLVRDIVKLGGCNFKVVAVEQKAFKNFSNITKVTIGNSVETIGKQSFSGCKKLKTLTIGSKVKTIGKQAFFNCKNLKKITIKTAYLSNKTVGAKAFKGIHAKAVIKVPKKQKKAYQKLLNKKGVGKTVKIK